MNGICTAHRTVGGKIQTITGLLMNVTAAQSIGALIKQFDNYDKLRPSTSTELEIPFEMDSETVIESSGTGASVSANECYFVVTVEDGYSFDPSTLPTGVTVADVSRKIANTIMVHTTVDPTAVNPDTTRPDGVFVAMDTAFRAAQTNALGAARKHLDDPTVFVESIIIKQ